MRNAFLLFIFIACFSLSVTSPAAEPASSCTGPVSKLRHPKIWGPVILAGIFVGGAAGLVIKDRHDTARVREKNKTALKADLQKVYITPTDNSILLEIVQSAAMSGELADVIRFPNGIVATFLRKEVRNDDGLYSHTAEFRITGAAEWNQMIIKAEVTEHGLQVKTFIFKGQSGIELPITIVPKDPTSNPTTIESLDGQIQGIEI